MHGSYELNLNPIVLYEFTQGIDQNIVYDISGEGDPLNLNIQNTQNVGNGYSGALASQGMLLSGPPQLLYPIRVFPRR